MATFSMLVPEVLFHDVLCALREFAGVGQLDLKPLRRRQPVVQAYFEVTVAESRRLQLLEIVDTVAQYRTRQPFDPADAIEYLHQWLEDDGFPEEHPAARHMVQIGMAAVPQLLTLFWFLRSFSARLRYSQILEEIVGFSPVQAGEDLAQAWTRWGRAMGYFERVYAPDQIG
jgi:hypothetical protein